MTPSFRPDAAAVCRHEAALASAMLVDIVVFDALDEMDAWGPAEVVRSAGKRGADMQVRLVTRLRRRWSKSLTAVEAARKGRRQPLEPAEAFADDVGRLSAVEAVALRVKHWSVPSTSPQRLAQSQSM